MIGYVYLTVNDVNDIVYIGKRQKPKFEKAYEGSGTHLKLAFKKYGKDKFHTTIIEECDTEEELCAAERKWISCYRSHGFELYNIAEGGKGGNMVAWDSLPTERRSEINAKNSESHRGEKNPFYGKSHSEETKAILREKNKHNRIPKELVLYKENQRKHLPQVLQIDKTSGKVLRVWGNWCDASKAVSKNNRCGYSHISECCRHERKSAYGFQWEFAEAGWTI